MVFLTQVDQGLYLTEEEEGDGPERSTQHKGHILKVMFLTAVARPRFNDRGECTFDGKIGLWPFVQQEAAQRTSVNRVRGTMETKPINMTYAVYLQYFLSNVGRIPRSIAVSRDAEIELEDLELFDPVVVEEDLD
jgi:hypothetical protein